MFIFWLVYVHPPVDAAGTSFNFLPAVNAVLNGCSAISLLIGFRYIKRLNIVAHRNAMFAAFIFSTAFLVCYLATYFLHGETRLPIAHTGALWYTYAIVLFATHIPLAIIALPMILITFFFSLTGRFPQHRAIARWTYSNLALRLGQWRLCLSAAGSRPQMNLAPDTRKLLKVGSILILTGAISALLTLTVFGGITRQDPTQTSAGWP